MLSAACEKEKVIPIKSREKRPWPFLKSLVARMHLKVGSFYQLGYIVVVIFLSYFPPIQFWAIFQLPTISIRKCILNLWILKVPRSVPSYTTRPIPVGKRWFWNPLKYKTFLSKPFWILGQIRQNHSLSKVWYMLKNKLISLNLQDLFLQQATDILLSRPLIYTSSNLTRPEGANNY